MTTTGPSRIALAVDATLLHTGMRRLGPDGARVGALALATWVTIAGASGGVAFVIALRFAVAAGLPQPVARACVVAALVVGCGASVLRVVSESSLVTRLARVDGLRSALDVPASVRVALGSVVHVWLLLLATTPLALAWLRWDAHPWVLLAFASTVLVAVGGVVAVRWRASGSRSRVLAGRLALGGVHPGEVSVLVALCVVAVVAASKEARDVRAALASLAEATAGVDPSIGAAGVVAGIATVVASDRLLDPGVVRRLRLARTLVDAGALRRLVALRLAAPGVLVWLAIGVGAAIAAGAWGAPVVSSIAVGGVTTTVGVGAAALALAIDSPAGRIVAAAGLVACASAFAVTVVPLALAVLTVLAVVVLAHRRLRCAPS